MNQPDKPKRRWPAFLAGAITSLLVIVIIIGLKFVAGSLANFGGPRVLTDAAVRARIEERGVTLPASAGSLYHSIVAFVDHTEFIGFTTAPEDAMPVAIAFARRATNSPAFVPGTRSEHSFVNKGPAGWGPEWASALWDISSVTNGRVFEIRHLFVLVDTDKSRVYISTWSE